MSSAWTFEEFYRIHEPQLKAIRFPPNLVQELFTTLQGNLKSDVKSDFSIQKLRRPMLIARRDLHKNQHFYVINHIWTSDGNTNAYKQLKNSPDLSERLAVMFGVPLLTTMTNNSATFTRQLDMLKIITNSSDEVISTVLSKHHSDFITSAVELLDSELEDLMETSSKEKSASKQDKCSYVEFVEAMKASGNLPDSANESYLSKMYEQFLKDSDGSGTTTTYSWSDDGDVITVYVPIPNTAKKQAIKSTLSTFHWKLVVFGKELVNGSLHGTVKAEESYWSIESPGMLCMTLEKVDQTIWPELIKGEERLSSDEIMVNYWLHNATKKMFLDSVLDAMWKFNQTYTISSPNGNKKEPVWYIMDEFGSALAHNDDPNFKCSPFFNIQNGKSFSLLWPIKDICKNDSCTRNFIPQIISNESIDICRARLKSFIGKNIIKDKTKAQEARKDGNKNISYPKIKHQKQSLDDNSPRPEMTVFMNSYSIDSIESKLASLNILITTDINIPVKMQVKTMLDMSINIDHDILPMGEMVLNKDYLNNYFAYEFTNCNWLSKSWILPRDLVDFNIDFEQTAITQYCIVKPVDKRILQIAPIVTNQYSRIVRLCEAGAIAVSKFVVDQPSFRDRRFSLSYTVAILDTRQVYIFNQPYIRLTSEKYEPNEFINEYDTESTVTASPEKKYFPQDEDYFDDFKVVMNKLLLPCNAGKGWENTEELIYQRVGKISKQFAKNLCFDENRKTVVLLGVDLVLNENADPLVVDFNAKSYLPNKDCIVEFLKLAQSCSSNKFIEVL